MNEPWLKEMIKAKKLEIKHEQTGGFIVLTASPKELKEFIAKYDTEQGFYMERIVFRRQK
jgi:hypothetical protein